MKWTLLLAYGLILLLTPLAARGEEKHELLSYEIETDDLRDWSRVYRHSDTLMLQSIPGDAEDPTRVKRGGVAGEYLLYRTKFGLRSFTVYAYGSKGGSYDHPAFYLSSDGSTFRRIAPDVHEEEGPEAAVTYESRGFPAGTKYLKIVFPNAGPRSSSIGKVVLNGPTSASASVPSGKVPYGRMIMLNRTADGDTVYYTTDGSDPRNSPTRKHYSSPIPVLSDFVLKVAAVNHSGTGKSAASRVSTYRYEVEQADPPPAGLDDPLDNFRQAAGRANLYIAKDNPGYFDNDKGRAVRATAAPGWIVYRSDADMTSFTVYSSFYTGLPVEKMHVFASEDGKTYREVDAESYPVGYPEGNWQQYACEGRDLPENTRYLKIELLGSAKAWSPQVMKVVINRNTASVNLSVTKDAEAAQAVLSSATPGARIYYRLNKGDDFLPYTQPLRLQGYNVLETYAVKDGMEPGPIRRYTVNASRDVQIDKYGQVVSANFPGKVTSDEQLAAQAKADDAYFAGLTPPADRDRYGGLAGSAQKYGLKATGYFAIQQLGDRQVMTTPEGNIYFSLAVNGVTAQETYTQVTGREEKFEYVPPYQGEYKPAYLGKDNFSFYVANKYRKTGVFPTEHSIYTEAISRLAKWGFNGIGAYSPEKYGEEGRFPYVRMLPLASMNWAKLDGISIFDIFAPDAAAKIDQAFAQALPAHKDDKMLIGYFIDNEYEYHKFYKQVPALKASKAAIKRELVERLQQEYKTIGAFNSAWGTGFQSFDALKEAALPLRTSQAWHDMDSFFTYYLDTFYRTVSQLFRKYDPNHLLLGDRWITTTFHDQKIRGMLSEAEGKYVDVISINYYTYKIETDLLDDVHLKSGGKPILMSEFGYGTDEQGLTPLMKNAAFNQFQRGMRYRNYVEGVATIPYVVGAHLFNYVDQAGLGRYWQGEWGERYNSGLVNVTDTPYKDYLQGIMATNDDIYKVMLGQRPKFYYDFSKG
jgi:hypothetical protein